MKQQIANKINKALWIVIALVLMGGAHKAWSAEGIYTLGSFLASAVVHGGGCYFMWTVCDDILQHYFKSKNENKQ